MASELAVALIGFGGVAFGAAVQWLVARSTIRAETERLHRQLSGEFRLQQFSEWQIEFRSVIAQLLEVTDPECRASFDKTKVVQLVIKAQLMLNPNVESHKRVNGLINKLALAVNGWHGPQETASVLRTHSELLESARATMFLPRQ